MKYIVKSQINDDIAIIKINRPEVLNALDNEVEPNFTQQLKLQVWTIRLRL